MAHAYPWLSSFLKEVCSGATVSHSVTCCVFHGKPLLTAKLQFCGYKSLQNKVGLPGQHIHNGICFVEDKQMCLGGQGLLVECCWGGSFCLVSLGFDCRKKDGWLNCHIVLCVTSCFLGRDGPTAQTTNIASCCPEVASTRHAPHFLNKYFSYLPFSLHAFSVNC